MAFRLHLALDSRRDEVSRMLDAVAEFWDEAGVPDADRPRLELALDEMLTNVIDYSGATSVQDGRPGIELTLTVEPVDFTDGPAGNRRVVAELSDNGRPHDPTAQQSPDISLDIDDRPIGGLGVLLTRTMVDTMEYRRENGWNHLRLTRAFAGPEAGSGSDGAPFSPPSADVS